jgi:hypothetical protein
VGLIDDYELQILKQSSPILVLRKKERRQQVLPEERLNIRLTRPILNCTQLIVVKRLVAQ